MPHDTAPPLPEMAVSIRGLVKRYGQKGAEPKLALDHVDLDIPRGEIFGLLGPNGAGKSTLINIMAQLVIKTEGKVAIWGIDLDQRWRIGYQLRRYVLWKSDLEPVRYVQLGNGCVYKYRESYEAGRWCVRRLGFRW